MADPAASGIIEPMIDGVALRVNGTVLRGMVHVWGDFDIESFHFGYDASNVFFRADATTLDGLADIDAKAEYTSPDLAIYFMQPNAVNFNKLKRTRTYYGNQILGFPSSTWWPLILTRFGKTGEPNGTCSVHKARLETKSAGFSQAVPTSAGVQWMTSMNSPSLGLTLGLHLGIQPE